MKDGIILLIFILCSLSFYGIICAMFHGFVIFVLRVLCIRILMARIYDFGKKGNSRVCNPSIFREKYVSLLSYEYLREYLVYFRHQISPWRDIRICKGNITILSIWIFHLFIVFVMIGLSEKWNNHLMRYI